MNIKPLHEASWFQQLNKDKNLLRIIFLTTFGIGLFAHAMMYFNTAYSLDALDAIVQNLDVNHKLLLGRFMQPVIFMIRGYVAVPWLLGALSLFWLSCATYLVVKVFELTDKIQFILVSGLFVTSTVLIYTNASYIHEVDCFMASFFFGMLGVYLFQTYKKGYLIGIVSLIISMGLYQAYMEVVVTTLIMLLFFMILDGRSWNVIWKWIVRASIMVISACVGYFICYKIVLYQVILKHGGNASGEYNSLEGVTGIFQDSILEFLESIIRAMYYIVLRIFFPYKNNHNGILLITVASVVVVWLGIVMIVKRNHIKVGRICSLLGLLAIMPLGMNFIYVLSPASAHDLTYFARYMVYVFAIVVLNRCEVVEGCKAMNWKKYIVYGTCGILIFYSCRFSNQIYLKKNLEQESTQFTYTRIVMEMEETDGYVMGKTPVVMVGTFLKSSALSMRPGIDTVLGTGVELNYSSTGSRRYFEYILGYPVNYVTSLPEECIEIAASMPCFPEKGYIQMVEDVMIIKISN